VRRFRHADGTSTTREVPGSFFEFITRDFLPEGGLDLTFDAGNAQGIFRMTSPQPGVAGASSAADDGTGLSAG
jgi:hypothetical protein